ncbi:MAG: glycosyltransferase family 4 protein [bacterium]
MEPLRLTLVSPFDPSPPERADRRAHVGGVERAYLETARLLAARGHDVTLVCSSAGRHNVAVEHGVLMVRRPRRMTILRAPVASLAKEIGRDGGLVQVAATYPFTTGPVLRRARRLGLPAVLDFHFEPVPGSVLGRLGAAAFRRAGPRAYSLADAVIVRSLGYAQSAPSLANVPPSALRVVPNGIATERFRPASDATREGHILFVGRLVPYKGLDVLLDALHGLRARVPLVVAGDGPLRRRLEGRARRLGLPVRFLGRVPDDALPRLYQQAEATVLPSVNSQEAFGITLLESMACGTPVIASDLPGVGMVARLGGVVARPADARSLAGAIRAALSGPPLPRGRALADRIHADFSWSAVTDRLESVYKEVLAAHADRGRSGGREVTSHAHPRGQPVL